MLGQTEIPAVVIEASESECLVMSLVENIARRVPRPIDVMNEIGACGNAATAMPRSPQNRRHQFVGQHDRLAARARRGTAGGRGRDRAHPDQPGDGDLRAETEEAQNLLLDAYETGKLRGKKLAAVRRLLDLRMRGQRKGVHAVRKVWAERHQSQADGRRPDAGLSARGGKAALLVKKSDFTQTRLLFIVEAIKDLLADDGFLTLLRRKGSKRCRGRWPCGSQGDLDD
jgi:ParB family chromosome partitioning protein